MSAFVRNILPIVQHSYTSELEVNSKPGCSTSETTDVVPLYIDGFYVSRFVQNFNLPSPSGLRFNAPTPIDRPQGLFRVARPPNHWCPRFIRLTDPRQVLLFADGSCLSNGLGTAAKAGCAFVFGPPEEKQLSHIKFRLELEGPDGVLHEQTSNRAELRAVIAALQFRVWWGEGFTSVVIATDSQYTVKGCTEWVQGWMHKDWRTGNNITVKNRDLWELLLDEVELFRERGCNVFFWKIPRSLNVYADRLAKEAAAEAEATTKFCKMFGVLV